MSKKQTAIEWLEQQTRTLDWHSLKRGEIFEKAKELEKKNLIDFANYALDKALDLDVRTAYSQTEQYYNNTFIQSIKTEK